MSKDNINKCQNGKHNFNTIQQLHKGKGVKNIVKWCYECGSILEEKICNQKVIDSVITNSILFSKFNSE
jgi:hypothetical protein